MLSLCFHYASLCFIILHYALVRTSLLVLLPMMRGRNIHRPPIDDDVRVQTAFYALMELNRKLAWAERMGFPAPTTTSTKFTSDQIQRSRRRVIQAAKGVYPLPTIRLGNDEILSSIKSHARRVGPATTSGHRRRRRRQFSPTLTPMIEREVASDGTY